MTDEVSTDAVARAPVAVLGVGERLRSARRARALSLQQVAEVLRLEESSIVALEESRFDLLGAPVFVRGHLKRYAELLGLAPDLLLDAYRAAAPGSDAPPDLGRARPRPEGVTMPSSMRWAVAAVVLAVIAIAVGGGLGQEEPAPAMTVVVPAAVTPPPQPESAAAPATVRLTVSVTADAWVVIDDAERRVLYGLQLRDSRQEFEVRPPLKISTSNAAAVVLAVDDAALPIPAASIVRNEASFEWSPPPPPSDAAPVATDTPATTLPPAAPAASGT